MEDLDGTYWELVRLGEEMPVTGAGGRRIDGSFTDDPSPMLYGFSGCNTYRSAYVTDGNQLSFGPGMSTMMACPEGMDVEHRFLGMLEEVASYRTTGGTLELCNEAGATLAVFEAAERST
ncbi:MAG: META domain-containing protein [Actinomycetota bacterium]